jgi:hypothetical protein
VIGGVTYEPVDVMKAAGEYLIRKRAKAIASVGGTEKTWEQSVTVRVTDDNAVKASLVDGADFPVNVGEQIDITRPRTQGTEARA